MVFLIILFYVYNVMVYLCSIQVLDQIHQQPMSVSLSIVSRPASESVVESFPVKIHGKEKASDCEEDISQYVSPITSVQPK